jgi:hypothetical protein
MGNNNTDNLHYYEFGLMFKTKIIYRLVLVFLLFAALILAPYSFTVIKQVEKLFSE